MENNSLSILEKSIVGANSVTPTVLGAGAVSTTQMGGGQGTAVLLETGFMQDKVNPIVQFNIDNTGVGNTTQTLRIGSVLGLADTYNFWAQTASAADNGVITDQNGVGCQFVQGFSDLVKSKSVIVTKVKVQTPAPDVQLNQNFVYKRLNFDSTTNEVLQNIAYTVEKSDYRLNLVEANTMLLLDAQYYLEYTVLANKQVTIFLNVAAANLVETFKMLPKFEG